MQKGAEKRLRARLEDPETLFEGLDSMWRGVEALRKRAG